MLYGLLKENLQKYSDKVALQIKRNEDNKYVRYTHGEVWQWAQRFAFRLTRMGIGTGTHVALWGESTPEWCLAYLGIHFAGGVVVPLDIQYQESVVKNLLTFAGAKAIVCTKELLPQALAVAQEMGIFVVTNDPDGGETSLFSSPQAPPDFHGYQARGDDTMSLIFTSGTTGDPKGVMLTCRNFVSNAQSLLATKWISDKDIFLCVLPLHHCYAFTGTFLCPMIGGATVTFQPVLKGPAIVSAMQETDVSAMLGVPQLFNMFAQSIQERIKSQPFFKRFMFGRLYSISRFFRIWFNWHLGKVFFGAIHQRFGSAFRFFMSGGAKLDRQVAEFFWNLGIPLHEGYGLTETAPVISCTPLGKYYPGSVGPALPGIEVRIDNPNPEGVGEIIMRGPNLMKGYYKNHEATEEVIKNEWFYTGDLGYLDKRGFLYITGRAKEVIVLESGKNVYPDEVERHYQQASLIKEMCVMGQKEPDGRILSLMAVILPNFEEIQRQQINNIQMEIKFQLDNLNLKIPTYMRVSSFKLITEALPRTRLGKLKRNQIENSLQEGQGKTKSEKKQRVVSEQDRLSMSHPAWERLCLRFQKLLDYKDEIFPSDSLELDLGFDSLKRMEVLVILEQEFGVKLTPDQINSLLYVRDILQCVPKDVEYLPQGEFNWKSLLEKKPQPPLDEMFHLERGFIKRFFVEIFRWTIWLICRICFGLRHRNFANLTSQKGAFLIAPSHQSYIDAVLLYCSLPSKVLERTIFIALDQIFRNKPLSWLIKPARIIRSASTHTAITSLQYASAALQRGLCVCIFPEGQRSVDGKLSPPMLGAGILACEWRVPVVPIAIQGAMSTYSRTNAGFHFANISLEVVEQITIPDKERYQQEDYREIVSLWAQKINSKITT